ncbi:hypothetical protein C8R45DRAFT_998825 [Mycena sanguinolenta]|nr:hypothetical protein C8R45DRAFT_998825 [Mycena sanguinolenta]
MTVLPAHGCLVPLLPSPHLSSASALALALRHFDLDVVLSFGGHPDFSSLAVDRLPSAAWRTAPISQSLIAAELLSLQASRGIAPYLAAQPSLAPPVLHPLLPRIRQRRRFFLVCSAPSPSSPPHPFPLVSPCLLIRPASPLPASSSAPRPTNRSCAAYCSVHRTLAALRHSSRYCPSSCSSRSISPPGHPCLRSHSTIFGPSVFLLGQFTVLYRSVPPRRRLLGISNLLYSSFHLLDLSSTYQPSITLLYFFPHSGRLRTYTCTRFFGNADLIAPYTS